MSVSVIVTWTHDGSGPPVQFNVQRRTQDATWSQVGTVPFVEGTTAYSFYDTIPTRGVRYRINAENAQGVSDWLKSDIFAFVPGDVSDIAVAVT